VSGLPQSARRARKAAVVGLALYVLAWLVVGGYQLTRIRNDGIAILAVTVLIASGLAILVRLGAAPVTRTPDPSRLTWLGVCGFVLIVPLAFPFGLAGAWMIATGVFAPAHSPLLALHLGRGARTAAAYGLLAALPALVGCAFVAIGTRRLRADA
jgi:hypothetical protein